MGWNTPPTFAVKEVATSTDLNTMSGDLSFLGAPPLLLVNQNATQSIANATDTVQVVFQNVIVDSMSGYNNTTGTYTIAQAGVYMAMSFVQYSSAYSATGANFLRVVGGTWSPAGGLRLNNSAFDTVNQSTITAFGKMAASQAVHVGAYQSTGGAINTSGDSDTMWALFWISN